MIIALLGRQPSLSFAELECVFGSESVSWFSPTAASIARDNLDVTTLGGVIKAGRITAEFSGLGWPELSKKIVQAYSEAWRERSGKITLGLSVYGFSCSNRDVQKTGVLLKSRLKKSGVSLRLIPNSEPELSSATSHHNKLGLADNKVELLIVRSPNGKIIVAESVGAQNITALAARDQGRPKRDAFVGMLPPKLALMMTNMAAGRLHHSATGPESTAVNSNLRLLDPFCGTGVILQEAALLGYATYGSDLSDKMIDYSRINLDWLATSHHVDGHSSTIEQGDAMKHRWQAPIDAVACEAYLGQPFSAPPSPAKLREVRGNCNHIISEFLKNIAGQIKPGTPLCVAVPAWRDTRGNFTHLPLTAQLDELGYRVVPLKATPDSRTPLLYYRENQVVARELLIITAK